MSGNRYSDSGLKITTEGLKDGSRLAEKDTVLLLVRGSTLHQRILVGITERDVAFNQDVKAIKPKEGYLDSWYLLFWFMSKEKDLLNMVENTGIGAGKLDTKLLQNLIIKIPSKEEREKIKSCAKAIDDKLVLNRQTNQTLEQIAQAIFKSWFVDFEPTRAKIAVKQRWKAINETIECSSPTCYAEELDSANQHARLKTQSLDEAMTQAAMAAISGKTVDELENLSQEQQEQLKATAVLFPDALVESELGEIPEGWGVNFLHEVAEITYGKNLPTKKLKEHGYPVFGGNGVIGFHDKYLYENPMTLVSCRGAASGKVLRSLPNSFITNNSLVIDHEKKGYLTQNYLEKCLERYGLVELTSGSAQPQMTIANMNPVNIVVPTRDIIEKHKNIVEPIFAKIHQQEKEEKSLEDFRDALLPKLLSGDLVIGT